MRWFSKKKNIENRILPTHLAIIMDGNGRWAKKRGLPRTAGHTAGASNFRTITKYCSRIGIKYLTVYAFSTENWKRPQDEVSSLMKLFKQYLEEALADFMNENIKVIFLGNKKAFSKELQDLIEKVELESSKKSGMVLNIAMNYGSRDEIIRATKLLISDVEEKKMALDDIDESVFSSKLYTAGQPDPDLVIRPSGEYRISNFLLWQSAYAEYIIMDILWPDFSTKDLEAALDEYSLRNRRFGGV